METISVLLAVLCVCMILISVRLYSKRTITSEQVRKSLVYLASASCLIWFLWKLSKGGN